MISKTARLAAFLLIFPLFPSLAHTETRLLSSPASAEKNPYFKKVLTAPLNKTEILKIQYLLARIRQSPYKFIRNGESYTGTKAAAHISMKYRLQAGNIKTAREFIDRVAAKSKISGDAYLVSIENEKHLLRDVLYNELALLEAQKSANVPSEPLSPAASAPQEVTP